MPNPLRRDFDGSSCGTPGNVGLKVELSIPQDAVGDTVCALQNQIISVIENASAQTLPRVGRQIGKSLLCKDPRDGAAAKRGESPKRAVQMLIGIELSSRGRE